MLKRNKILVIITSLIILLPICVGIFYWNELPAEMATHFGSDNEPNGWSSKAFAVFGLPLFIFACHLICVFCTANDPKKKNISDRMFQLLLLICPLASIVCAVANYSYALSVDFVENFDLSLFGNLFIGILFLIIGNYLPKTRQNYTVGIKIPWTLSSAENWNRTHRLAGWLWMLGGIVMILNIFLKSSKLLLVVIAILILVPSGYSVYLYQKEKKE